MLVRAKILLIATMVGPLVGCVSVPTSGAVSTGVSFDYFYSDLSPHGSWMASASYGRVWQPREYAEGWNPYYDGHWVYTDLGWTWVSEYEWGAVPYHYGTWVVDADYGWVWVPGTVWAPSWVVFRNGPDYIGWAPVSPRFTLGVSMRFDAPQGDAFVFVSSRDFLSPRIRPSIVVDNRRTTIINNTQIVNNITIENNVVVNRGIDVTTVERASGRQVRAVPIEQVSRVAPGRHVDREALRVDRRGEREIRATEPVSERNTPEPSMGNRSRRPDAEDGNRPRESAPERRPSARGPKSRPDEPDATEPQRDNRSRGPDVNRPDPRGQEPRHELRPRESGPEHGPNMNDPQNPRDENGATKPRQGKRPPREERKQKREKKQKPEQEKPPQGQDSDGDKPPAHLS